MVEHGARVADWREAFFAGPRQGDRRRAVHAPDRQRRRAPGGAHPHAEGAALSTPAADGFRMPAEWAPHERTLMGWPCRRELWGDQLGHAKARLRGHRQRRRGVRAADDGLRRRPQDAAEARAALTGDVEVVELAIDDSWLRDSGPIFVARRATGARAGVHFGFNSWGEKFTPYDARRGGRRPARRPPRRPPLRGAVRAGGRLDRRRRRGHAADDRAVPAAPQPQPGDDARGDRAGAARLPGRRARGVARPGPGRGQGHRRPRRPHRRLHAARRGAAAEHAARHARAASAWPTTARAWSPRASRSSTSRSCPRSRSAARRSPSAT